MVKFLKKIVVLLRKKFGNTKDAEQDPFNYPLF